MASSRQDDDGTDLEENECQFCVQVEPLSFDDTELGKSEVEQIFHGECSKCPKLADPPRNLCPMCEHLRLRHLADCCWSPDLSLKTENPKLRPHLTLQIKPGEIFEPSEGCEFCGLIQHQTELERPFRSHRLSGGKLVLTFERPFEHGTRGWPHPHSLVHIAHDPFILQPMHFSHGDAPPSVQATPQWSTLSEWLNDCEKNHIECGKKYLEPPKSFRVIDVRRRKIVKTSKVCRYVALSYVWGLDQKATTLTATKKTISSLEEDGGLQASQLPRTIEDAIQACIRLGTEYLWVDRLCIIQDDDDNKHQQIDAMANIYSSADLVIIVLDGDADTGIPRMQQRSEDIQKRIEINGSTLINELPKAKTLISNSAWAKRGWTYQEAALARRKLYFSRAQAFFQCKDHGKEETVLKSVRSSSLLRSLHSPHLLEGSSLARFGWSFHEWTSHVYQYSCRNLSYSSDIYDAMAGILSVLLPRRDGFLFGLPRPNFDRALLWRIARAAGYRTSKSKNVLLPRWSWVSVHGRAYYEDWPEYAGTLVAWKFQEEVFETGQPLKFVPVRDPWCAEYENLDWKGEYESNPYTFRHDIWDSKTMYPTITTARGHSNGPKVYGRFVRDCRKSTRLLIFGIACSQGCIEADWPGPRLTQDTFSALGEYLESNWSSLANLEHDFILGERAAGSLSLPSLQEQSEEADLKIDPCAIHGRAQVSVFTLERSGTAVIDDRGSTVGQIEKIEYDKLKALPQPPISGKHELIALSVGYCDLSFLGQFTDDAVKKQRLEELTGLYKPTDREETVRRTCKVLGPDGLDISYLDSEGSALLYIPIVHVMLAEWDGPVARRLGIGWVFLTKWVKSDPQFKTVYLN